MTLKTWFRLHFAIDLIFATALLLAPNLTLQLFNIPSNHLLARIVAAALLAIGISSYLTTTKQEFRIMLKLKIIWSLAAIAILIPSALSNSLIWILVSIFTIFSAAWIYYQKVY